ncbi:MAG TPA: protein kinase, partial [Symbiobacteriaceae bacterium]|nr:protein kinase [Symbiobacteriaceae bacterium]
MTCQTCGAQIPPGEEFCLECGSKASGNTAAVSASTAPATCPACKATIPAGEEFCLDCGAKAPSAAPTAPPPVAQPATRTCPNPDCQLDATGRQRFCRRCGTRLPDPPAEATGPDELAPLAAGALVAEKYRITKVLAQGGMGFLYLAEDALLQRTVVLKTALRKNDAELIRQQADEYRYLAAIKHPNIVGIYEVIQLLGVPAIVMEFVQGQTIAKQIEAQNAPLAPAEAIRYILQILPAFSYLHRFEGGGLVYQDFKLQNMMREQLKDGSYRVVLIDLGTVVRANDPDAPLWGTRGYYPPELEAKGQKIIPIQQTDLYTIGRALLEMVTGMDVESPLFGVPPTTAYEVLSQHPALYRFLERACHADPAKRFPTAEAMTEQLRGVLRQVEGALRATIPSGAELARSSEIAARADEPFVSARFVSPDYIVQGHFGARAATMLDRQDPAYQLLRDGDVAVRLGSNAKAWAQYEQAIRQSPKSGQARFRLLDLLLEVGPNQARRLARQAAGATGLFVQNGQYNPAAILQAAAPLLAPEEEWQLRWYGAKLAQHQGQLDEATNLIRTLMAELPGEITPQIELARILRQQGNLPSAFTYAARMAAADPANGLAIAELAATLRHLTDGPRGNGAGGLDRQHLISVLPVLEQLQSKTEFVPFYLLQGDLYR